jgi:hypothetical protein
MAVSVFVQEIQTFVKRIKEGLSINLKQQMGQLARCFDQTVDAVLLSYKATGDGRCSFFWIGKVQH